MSTSPLGLDPYIVWNAQGSSFLDAGCGYGKWGYLLRKYRWDAGKNIKIVGVDIFEPHLSRLKKEGIYDELYCCDCLKMPFKDKEFDTVIGCELIEHLPKSEGQNLFDELKRVSRLSFVITTPNFDCFRGGLLGMDGFNKYEGHQCNYTFDEFKHLGFTQIVGLGLKTPSHKLTRCFSSLGYFLPRLSQYLIGFWFSDGVKRVLEVE